MSTEIFPPPTEVIASPEAAASQPAADRTAERDTSSAANNGPEVTQVKFADMRLKVGDFLPLECRGALSRSGTTVGLIGWVDGVSLVVTIPRDSAGPLSLKVGETVTLRAFTGKSAFAFRTSVLRVAYQPFGYMHLRFPDQIDAVVIRRSFRHRTQLSAHVGHALGEASATILNVGTTGALLGVREPLPTTDGLRVRTSFELHGVPVTLDLKAAVRSTSQSTNELGVVHQYGVEFQELTANDRLVLGSLLWFEMHERPADAV